MPLECLMLKWRRMRLLAILAVLFDTLGNVSKQQGVRKTPHVVDFHASQRLIKTTIYHKRPTQTATTFAANSPGTFNNRTSALVFLSDTFRSGRPAHHFIARDPLALNMKFPSLDVDLKVALQILGRKFYKNAGKSSLYSQSLLIFIHSTPVVERQPITREIRDLLWPRSTPTGNMVYFYMSSTFIYTLKIHRQRFKHTVR